MNTSPDRGLAAPSTPTRRIKTGSMLLSPAEPDRPLSARSTQNFFPTNQDSIGNVQVRGPMCCSNDVTTTCSPILGGSIWEQAQSGVATMNAKLRETLGPREQVATGIEEACERLKIDLLSELKKDMQGISDVVKQGNKGLEAKIESMAVEMRALRSEVQTLRSQVEAREQGGVMRALGRHAANICTASRSAGKEEQASLRLSPTHPACSKPGSEEVSAPFDSRLATDGNGIVSTITPEIGVQPAQGLNPAPEPVPLAPASTPVLVAKKSGKLGPVVRALEDAVKLDGVGKASEVLKDPLIEALEACVIVLDTLQQKLGSNLQINCKKLRNAKASPWEKSYRPWLLTELPVHQATGYKSYVDESAFMANLWIGWTLEFFVEMFALLRKGSETKLSAESAYKKTLSHHHGFVQRTVFQSALAGLPPRKALLEKLQGDASEDDLYRELDIFVKLGRSLVLFCSESSAECNRRMQEEQKIYASRR